MRLAGMLGKRRAADGLRLINKVSSHFIATVSANKKLPYVPPEDVAKELLQ